MVPGVVGQTTPCMDTVGAVLSREAGPHILRILKPTIHYAFLASRYFFSDMMIEF